MSNENMFVYFAE